MAKSIGKNSRPETKLTKVLTPEEFAQVLMESRAHFDAKCRNCHRPIAWSGTVFDAPEKCPHCGK